ncbi:phage tail protein [Burkholderia glumae]|uniref:phage tail protein n=1 Tax=Burkholderia glumae TaxID=337 RepID=UPI002151FBE1|nr:phage tail protein [Burkholderia glumae]
MANLKEESRWEDGVYQFETSDPVEGGPDGIDNVPARQLANRTRYLKDRADAADKVADDKLDKSGGTMAGAVLGKPGAIAPNNPKNAGFAFDGAPDSGLYSPDAGTLQLGVQGVAQVEVRDHQLALGGPGLLTLIAGGRERARVTPEGRLLLGTAVDNGADGLQVAYQASFAAGVRSAGSDSGGLGGQFRAAAKDYGVMLRNDDKSCYLLQTKKGEPYGGYNDLRPFSWNLTDGRVAIDANGSGTTFGGDTSTAGEARIGSGREEGRVWLGPLDGYFFASEVAVGWWSRAFGSFQYMVENRSFCVDEQPVWHGGNLAPLDVNAGGTLKGELRFAAGARIFLSAGTSQNPSLTFGTDGLPDTGLYHIRDGSFGVTCNGMVTVRFTSDAGTIFDRPVKVPTPATGDRSTNAATTAFVMDAIASVAIGQIVWEVRTAPRAGFLKLNGAELKRADYPQLWSYAQASGALVSDANWKDNNWGNFSDGDTASTFRLPDLRGEFVRCWDDGRGVDAGRKLGSWQDSLNRSHGHGATASAAPDHTHTAWTDTQGWHSHNVRDPGHAHTTPVPYGGGGGGQQAVVGPYSVSGYYGTATAGTGIWLDGAGNHGHNVGIGGAGNHGHDIKVNPDGGNEARSRNIALLAMIRAY